MTRKRNPNRVHRRVDGVNNTQDHWCLLLAMRGRSNRAIFAKTGLSNGQISYRLRLYGVSRMDYRNGVGPLAKKVDKATEGLAEQTLLSHLRTYVGKEPNGEPEMGGRH